METAPLSPKSKSSMTSRGDLGCGTVSLREDDEETFLFRPSFLARAVHGLTWASVGE